MQLRRCTWTVLLVVILNISSTFSIPFRSDDYYYLDPDMEDDGDYLENADLADFTDFSGADYRPKDFDADYVLFPRSAETTTECETEPTKNVEAHTTTNKPHAAAKTTCIAIIPGQPAQSALSTQSPQPAQQFQTPQHPQLPAQQSQIPLPSQTAQTPTTPPLVPATSTKKPSLPTVSKITATEEETTTCIPEDESTTTVQIQKPTTVPYPYSRPGEATTCVAVKNAAAGGANMSAYGGIAPPPLSYLFPAPSLTDQEGKTRALHSLVQHLYVAQARVQLEAIEIKKAQAVANSAQQQLEEAANHVRSVTAALQNAQQEVASAAIRAQTAQLQLAAHDQLLFAARQDVDALSSQMVGLQAAEGISVPTVKFDIGSLLDKLKQPLTAAERPTAVPPVIAARDAVPPNSATFYVDDDYE